MQPKVITLLSDFGLKDPYIAEMKAVVLSKCLEAKIVDISHEIDKFNIRMGAFVLASAAPYFPKGTVHIAVVDPGVGTKRRPLVVETKYSYFVGPDNGVLMLAALKETLQHVYVVENPRYMLSEVSKTFHGRDVFAPVAAYLAGGCVASEVGEEIFDYVVPDFAEPRFKKDVVFGEVLHVDDFGNVITNIPWEILKELAIQEGGLVKVEIGGKAVTLRLCSAYGDVSLGKALAIIGSHNFLEVSVNQGSAAKQFKAKCGDFVRVQRKS
ncbi:MAG: S-adenosyl-l-methionine hydroxide adenosyltransferase family protein [Candidatus Bathyarchaeia archaeon]